MHIDKTQIRNIIIVIVIVASLFYLMPFLVSVPVAHAGDTAANMKAEAEANTARKEIALRKSNGEKGLIQVSGCVQKPEKWKVVDHNPIPGTIFVSVASYRDDECKDTVYDLFKQARNPDNIYVGVCQQNKENEEDCFDKCAECSQRKQSGHIRVLNFSYMDARGPTFARYQCSKLWRGEEFYFQIDSHLKFEKNWDETLIQQMRATKDPKAVVGAYPPTQAQMDEMKANNFTTMITMCPGKFDETGMPTITARVVSTNGRKSPLPVGFQPAGMMCFPGRALLDVPYDPYLSYLFFSEEFLFSARLYTHGYNLYAPVKNFAVHHYGRKGKPKYFDDHKNSEPCKAKALQRVKYILGMIDKKKVHPDYFLEINKYGLGNKRSLEQYERYAGINISTKTTTKGCPLP